MASKYIPECDCGEEHEDVLGKIGFATDAFEANARWEACPRLLERFLALFPEGDLAVARVREGLAKLAKQREVRTARADLALDVQLRALLKPEG